MNKRRSVDVDPIEILQNSRETYLVTEGGHALRIRVQSLSQQTVHSGIDVFGARVSEAIPYPVRMEIRGFVDPQVFDAGSATRSSDAARVKELEAENSLLRESIRLMGLGKVTP